MGDYSSDNHTFTFSSYHYTPYTYQDTDLHEYEWDNVDKERQRLFAAGFFVLLFLGILGLLGNAFQLHAIVSFPAMRRKPENVYLANIAVAGLFYMTTVGLCVIIVCGCEAFKELYYTYYSYHQFLRLNFVIEIGTLVVLFQLGSMITALAVNQYRVVVRPDTVRTSRDALMACVGLWIVGAVIGAIYIVVPFKIAHNSYSASAVGRTLRFILHFIVPVCVTLALNIVTSCKLRNAYERRARNARGFTELGKEEGEEEEGDDVALREVIERAKGLPNVIPISISFVVCWLIYFVIELIFSYIYLLKHYRHSIFEGNNAEFVSATSEFAVQVNIVLNPVLLTAWNPKFRQHLYRIGSRVVKCALCQPMDSSVPLEGIAE